MPRKRLHVARHAAHLLLRPALTMNVRRASRPPSARLRGSGRRSAGRRHRRHEHDSAVARRV